MRLPMVAVFAAVLAMPAQAQDRPAVPPEVRAIFPPSEDYCYAYAAHTAAKDMKPKQKLTDFNLYRLYDPNPSLEEIELPRQEAIAYYRKPENANWTDVLARFSDKPFLYSQSVSCWVSSEDKHQVFCGVECDGGSFNVDTHSDGITARFDTGSGGLSLNQSCGEPDDAGIDRWMTAAEAGGKVVLEKQPASACSELDRKAHPAFAKDPVPLRERIATFGWRCLNRSYDKAHMAKHPKQKVTNISVAISGKARVDRPSAEEYPSTLLDVTLSFMLRNGEVKSRAVQCRAFQYEFSCDGGFRLRRRDGASALLVAGEYTETGKGTTMLDTKLGSDDAVFRLDAETHDDCSIE